MFSFENRFKTKLSNNEWLKYIHNYAEFYAEFLERMRFSN
jgi:hypothetical protein